VLGLLHLIEEFLATVLSTANAAEMLQLADIYSASNLRKYIEQYISTHAKEVADSDGYMVIREELQNEIQGILQKTMKKCCKRRNSTDSEGTKRGFSCVII